MATIGLSRGLVTVVDDADEAWLRAFTWYALKAPDTYYAVTGVYEGDYVTKQMYMHRLIMEPEPWELVDHVNGDGLDNRRSNLRIATTSQNLANQTKRRTDTSSRYKGVSLNRRAQKWHAYITVRGVRKHLGLFVTEEEAAIAYNAEACRSFGSFARLNEVGDCYSNTEGGKRGCQGVAGCHSDQQSN